MKHIGEMSEREMIALRNQLIEAAVDFVVNNDFSGLSHAGWFNFYEAIEDAIRNEWEKAKGQP